MNSDSATFEVLNSKYSKDKNNIYFWGEKIEGTDALSFKILNDEYGIDKNYNDNKEQYISDYWRYVNNGEDYTE